MANMINAFLVFFLSNFTLTFFALGLLVSAAAIARAPRPLSKALAVEKLLSWYIFFSIGVSYFYNFVCHVFFGEMAAAFIGWADSPFQFEVGTASLGYAFFGFLAAWRGFDLRLGAVGAFSIFTLGAAAGHIYQIVAERNFAPGNAGVILYTDIFVPLFGLVLLCLQRRYGQAGKPSLRRH